MDVSPSPPLENGEDSCTRNKNELKDHVSAGEGTDQRSVDGGISTNIQSSNSRKGKTIPGFAREVIVKVAEVCEQEANKNVPLYSLNAPTRRAAMYTGVSERTIQRIRGEDKRKRKMSMKEENVNGKKYKSTDYGEKEVNYKLKKQRRKGQVIPNSARDIISRVIMSCYKEFEDGEYLAPLICRTRRTALYTGVSVRTIQRIKQEDEVRNKVDQEQLLMTPGKKRKRSTFRAKIDEFDFHCIRMLVDDLLLNKKEFFTCSSLLKAVKESNIKFPYGVDTLSRLLHSKGFNWRAGQKGKKVLVEKEDIFLGRTSCIKKIKSHEMEGKLIVYLDDKFIGLDADNTNCDNNGLFGAEGGICCSGRLIALTEVWAMAMARRSFKMFRPNSNYSTPTPNIATVEKWLNENLFPNIPANSLIVMNTNTCDQNDISMPNEYSTKTNLIEFLKRKKLKHDHAHTWVDLFDIVKNYFEMLQPNQRIEIDKIIEQHGHTALRLPIYMSEFSPIELAYADIKRYLRDNIIPAKASLNLLKKTTLKAVKNLQNETFEGYVNHIINMENYFLQNETRFQEHYVSVTNKTGVHLSDENVILQNKPEARSLSNENNTITVLNKVTAINLPNEAAIEVTNVCGIDRTNMFAFMPPHSQIVYGKTVATPVDAPVINCANQELDNSLTLQPGPSYLNL